MIAALFVEEGGVYSGLEGVDIWPESRDARKYAGPRACLAHPPCARWGKYATGGPRFPGRFVAGDDGGCFAAALSAVRRWGGVLEHPRDSLAWEAHGLLAPPRIGGWRAADLEGGFTCCVEQAFYGHPARKATWLYAKGTALPRLQWGRAPEPDHAGRSEAWRARASKDGVCVLLSRRQRAATPIPFRDVLLAMARSVST